LQAGELITIFDQLTCRLQELKQTVLVFIYGKIAGAAREAITKALENNRRKRTKLQKLSRELKTEPSQPNLS